jgi:hypothetical protein
MPEEVVDVIHLLHLEVLEEEEQAVLLIAEPVQLEHLIPEEVVAVLEETVEEEELEDQA